MVVRERRKESSLDCSNQTPSTNETSEAEHSVLPALLLLLNVLPPQHDSPLPSSQESRGWASSQSSFSISKPLPRGCQRPPPARGLPGWQVCVCSLIVSVFVRRRPLVHVRVKLISAVSLNTLLYPPGWTFSSVCCLQALTHGSCSSCVSQRLWLICLFVSCVSNNEQHLLPLLLWVCFPPDCGFLMCHPSPW